MLRWVMSTFLVIHRPARRRHCAAAGLAAGQRLILLSGAGTLGNKPAAAAARRHEAPGCASWCQELDVSSLPRHAPACNRSEAESRVSQHLCDIPCLAGLIGPWQGEGLHALLAWLAQRVCCARAAQGIRRGSRRPCRCMRNGIKAGQQSSSAAGLPVPCPAAHAPHAGHQPGGHGCRLLSKNVDELGCGWRLIERGGRSGHQHVQACASWSPLPAHPA